jgi:predicted Ser/Thr protein kinase
MNESTTCPKCGAGLPRHAPSELCPKCLMQAGLTSESAASAAQESRPTALASGFIAPDPCEIQTLFPQLEILELLGKGGMGAVYKVRQPGLDRLVAVKILPPEFGADPAFAERFTREARALARLHHQNIVSVFDFGRADGQFFFIMEFVDGTNLRQLIESGGLKPEEALAIVPQICEALQFAHSAGIVHRDIKPENILVDRQGRVKIADFGLAKLLGKAAEAATLTAAHQVMGTLHYMAPEQMRGAAAVDHRADIYSLGVVFYEMLTGNLPVGRFEPPSKKVQIDVRLDEVVLRSLENEPGRRYQQVSEVKTELEAIRSTVAPAPPAAQRDPLDGLRELLRFAMTPNRRYAKRVAVPMLILFVLWMAATVTAHAVFGQKGNYQEKPIVLIQGGGLVVLILASFLLHIVFAAYERENGATVAAGLQSSTPSGMATPQRTTGRNAESPHDDSRSHAALRDRVSGPADGLIVFACVALLTTIGISLWLWLVPTARLLHDQTRTTLQMMAATHAGYGTLMLAAGLLMRRLRARMFVLLVATVVGIAVPAVLALNVMMEWGRIPQWPVIIPMWLGVPVAVWATTLLFRRDIRTAFERM